MPFEWTKVVQYPVDKVIWSVYILLNMGFFIAKAVYYYTGDSNSWTPMTKSMLEVQSVKQLYLPLLLNIFAAGTLLLTPRTKLLK